MGILTLAKQPHIEIIYEDDDFLVVNKPAGWRIHDDNRGVGPTVADWAIGYFPAIKNVGEALILPSGEKLDRAGMVHRLDKDTSGVMTLAKTDTAFAWLKQQFKNRQVEKVYQAIVYGVVKGDEEKVINLPIGRSNKDPRRRVASKKAAGKLRPAETRFRALERFQDHTLIEARPLTGRTHQIRVHLKAAGYPVAGDKLYAPDRPVPAGLARQALHATRLSFLSSAGVFQTFTAPRPADIDKAITILRQRNGGTLDI